MLFVSYCPSHASTHPQRQGVRHVYLGLRWGLGKWGCPWSWECLCPRAIPALSKACLLQKGMGTEGAHCIRGMWEEDVFQPSNWVCVWGGGVCASKSLQDAVGTGKSWVPSNLFTVTTSYETSSKPLYCVSLCSDLCKLKSTPCLLTRENCFGYRGSNGACCLGNFKVCHSRNPSGWICWNGGSRLDFSELSVLFLLLFLLGIL